VTRNAPTIASMVDVPERKTKERAVRIRSAVAIAVLSSVIVGVGAFFVGHEMGESDASGPSSDFIHQQRADAVAQIQDTTSELVQIEQSSVELLAGKTGAEVDTAAFERLHLKYTQVYDAVLAERGRLTALFDAPVLAAAKQVTHQCNVALETLYLEPSELPGKSESQIAALVFNSHSARKAQWAALRKFTQAAWAEIDPDR
jgi:hypothetical protein